MAEDDITGALSEKDVRDLLAHLNALILKHQRIRLKNDAIVFGTAKGKVSAALAKVLVESERDKTAEAKAMAGLRKLYQALELNWNKGPDELKPPEEGGGLGAVPILAIAVVAGGALTLTSLFTYLTEREERIQRELGGGSVLDFLGLDAQAMTLLKLAGFSVAAWYGWKWYEKEQEKKARASE